MTAPAPHFDSGSSVNWAESLRLTWRRLWSSPDPDLIEAGFRGEWMVAGIRLLLVLLVLSFPLDQYLQSPLEHSRKDALWVAVAALAEALVMYSAVLRSWGRRWIGFLSGFVDVSLVTICLWIYLRLDQPLGATNDLVIFPVYLLAIGATSLRYDWRICILTGTVAILEYLGLVSYAVWLWDLDDPSQPLAATFSWSAQLCRLALLGLTTLLATTVVVRAREQRRLSTRDRLTDLANRGFFDDSMLRLGAIAARSGEPMGVLMVDVDHFKRFNDTHGHLAGDEALRSMARILSASFRTTDLVARYGGEEFVALFPGMSMTDARRRMEELRATIERVPVTIDGAGHTAHMTASMGIAIWPDDGATLEEALAIADMRLYQAKRAGRNRVVAETLSEEQMQQHGARDQPRR